MNITPLILIFFFFTTIYTFGVYGVSLMTKRRRDIERDYNYTPTVTVMMSAFNEGKAVYDTIKSVLASTYPAEKLNVVAFDDCSKDDTWQWMEKAQQEFPAQVIIQKNKHNQGKATTLADAALVATGEILISTDSDCVFDVMAVRELVSCFKDPKMGSVGGYIGIYNTNDSCLVQMQAILYAMDFHLFKPFENSTRTVQCLGGPLVAFRRQLYLDIMPSVKEYNFLGERITIGEDRVITQHILRAGYKTFVTLKAKCWVSTPVTWKNYLNQQIRWRRSAVGQWVYTIFTVRKMLRTAGPIATIGSLLPIVASFSWLMFILYVIHVGTFLPFMVTYIFFTACVGPMIAILFNHYVGSKDSLQMLNRPLLAGFHMALWFGISTTIVTPLALLTLDDGGWVTRQNGIGGNV